MVKNLKWTGVAVLVLLISGLLFGGCSSADDGLQAKTIDTLQRTVDDLREEKLILEGEKAGLKATVSTLEAALEQASGKNAEASYTEGKAAGYDEGYKKGSDEGYKKGYDTGYVDGSEDGYDKGYKEAREEWRDKAYNKGYDDGYDDGYDEGYDDGYKKKHRRSPCYPPYHPRPPRYWNR